MKALLLQFVVAAVLVAVGLVYFRLYGQVQQVRIASSDSAVQSPLFQSTTMSTTAAAWLTHTRLPKFKRWKEGNVNACILILARNRDFATLKKTVVQLENQFNKDFNYPYVILSDAPFWLKWRWKLQYFTRSTVDFGLIPPEHWSTPEWIDPSRLHHLTFDPLVKNVSKAVRISYHHMCRFYSGFFFHHELTLRYDYYLRLDAHAQFPCPFPSEDPFQTLVRRNKLYGFTIACSEPIRYMPTLWSTVKRWLKESGRVHTRANQHVAPLAASLSQQQQAENNNARSGSELCDVERFQFWNNFEMASFAIFRNETYLSFFDYLDKAGGFYYERWGDAPVHTFYIMLMVELSRVHRFDDIGYGHDGCYTWPANATIRGQCETRPDRNCTFCHQKWAAMSGQL